MLDKRIPWQTQRQETRLFEGERSEPASLLLDVADESLRRADVLSGDLDRPEDVGALDGQELLSPGLLLGREGEHPEGDQPGHRDPGG